MENFFDKALHFLGKNQSSIVALNIGSMDGVMFDEMIGYTNMYNFNVLYVEPIPYLFERLQSNIKNKAMFENSAISDYNGVIEMMTIDKEIIDSGLVHSCFYGMSAVYPPKNGLGSEFDRPTVEKYGKLIKVPCITFETLINKHKINNFEIVKIDAEGHDFNIFKQIDLKKYNPKVIRLEWINLTDDEQKQIINIFNDNNYVYEISGQDIVGLPKYFYDEIKNTTNIINNDSNVTLVTGLWNLGRNELTEGWSRSYEGHYLKKFEELLKIDNNIIIFGDSELESFVWERRKSYNTQFIYRDLNWFKNNEFYDKIQKIRTNKDWYGQVSWLQESTQSKLEMYNPIVMSKIFLLHDAKILDKFNSEYIFWIDAGLTNTVNLGYFTHDNVISNLPKLIKKFTFLTFSYETNSEIHGFEYNKLCEISEQKVNKVARGGFFGGPKQTISEINNIYYQLLNQTLSDGYMGTEESIFTIMVYKYPELFDYSEIEPNGLVWLFFENLKNKTLDIKSEKKQTLDKCNLKNIGLYVIGFNSPNQLKTLIQSFVDYDINFLNEPKKYLLNNSTDRSTDEEYVRICEQNGFEIIWKHENLGICGGRQFIAEHFDSTDLDGYFFFEDDMFFYPKKGEVCRNGFNRYIDNLYEKVIEITEKESFDFLKLNFSEFFGDNSTQWSWYNVPQVVREEYFPNNTKLPVQGLDPNAPRTKYNTIKIHKGLPYADGDVFYCNWPQIVTREGNKKMFLDTKWAHPFEQTWMSHMFQETKKGKLYPGILLLTPTEHDRYEHYDRSIRKES
jgi:FkbM family methyltransferase